MEKVVDMSVNRPIRGNSMGGDTSTMVVQKNDIIDIIEFFLQTIRILQPNLIH